MRLTQRLFSQLRRTAAERARDSSLAVLPWGASPRRVQIRGRMVIALNLAALLAAVAVAASPLLFSGAAESASVVNIAGRQRLLVQRIGRNALALALPAPSEHKHATREALQTDVANWIGVQSGLRHGSRALGLEPEDEPEIIARLDALVALGSRMSGAVARVAEASRQEIQPRVDLLAQVQSVSNDGERVIAELDALVGLYVTREAVRARNRHLLFSAALVVSLLLSVTVAAAYAGQGRTLRASWESLRRLGVAIEQASEGIVITDRSGTIEYVNPAYCLITGFDRMELLGRNPRIHQSGAHDRAFYEAFWGSLSGEGVWRGRIIDQSKDGRTYQTEQSIAPVRNAVGDVTHYVGILVDISERIQLENQLNRAERMQSIAAMTSGIAHDLNNVLTPVLGFAELIRLELAQGSAVIPLVEQIKGAAIRAKELIESILRRGPLKGPQQVGLVAKGVLQLLSGTIPSSITVHLNVSPESVPVEADFNAVHTVLLNLCVNAVQAMPNGGTLAVSVDTVGRPSEAAGCQVRLRVSDTGVGMAEDTRARIFQPFFSTKGADKGTGLGLFTVRTIVEQADGRIEVESAPGKGSTFTVYLPSVLREDGGEQPRSGQPAVSERG